MFEIYNLKVIKCKGLIFAIPLQCQTIKTPPKER